MPAKVLAVSLKRKAAAMAFVCCKRREQTKRPAFKIKDAVGRSEFERTIGAALAGYAQKKRFATNWPLRPFSGALVQNVKFRIPKSGPFVNRKMNECGRNYLYNFVF